MSEGAERSVVQVQESAKSRKINKVPFVELHHGRLQGVVSSGVSHVPRRGEGEGGLYSETDIHSSSLAR